MRSIKNSLGDWINLKFGDQDGLAEKLKITRGAVSAYKTGRNDIPMKIQEAIRKLGYTGPWPREEAQEATAAGAGAYVTREEYGELVGRLKRLEEDFRALLPLAVAVKDLDERVRKLAGDPESRG